MKLFLQSIRVIRDGTKYEARVETDGSYDDDSFYISGYIERDGVEVGTSDILWPECKKMIVDEYTKLKLATALSRIDDVQKDS